MLDALNGEGNTYVTLADLLTQANELLQIEQFDPIANCINELQEQGKVVVSGDTAALQNIFQTEIDIARSMKNLVQNQALQENESYDDAEIEAAIEDAEDKLKIKYDGTQKLAIKNALKNPISILTGGPELPKEWVRLLKLVLRQFTGCWV